MHMILRPDADKVQLNAEKSGFTVDFPVPGMVSQMQSNLAATLNIDWLLDVACGELSDAGVERSRGDFLNGLDDLQISSDPWKQATIFYRSAIGGCPGGGGCRAIASTLRQFRW
jgi:erythritol kinase (D-erythritol 1-phosphate-forming)